MAVVEGCPAFTGGCPFSKMDADLLPTVMESLPDGMSDSWIREKCLAFKDGCPFKDTDSVEILYNKLSEMPASHQVSQDSIAARAVGETLRKVHAKSVSLKSNFSNGCPVFATSCPFKTVTTYGAPLVNELDAVVSQWGLQSAQDVTYATKQGGKEVTPLSKSLKAGTKVVHRSAENVHFVRDFLKGSVPKESYIELLRALYHVYHAIEAGLDALPEHLKHCDFVVLKRAPALLEDLTFYLGSDARRILDKPPSAAAQQYVERVKKLSHEDPVMLLAHAYTRYLGDLSGGQILARAASKAYNLPHGKGTAFYNFNGIGSSPTDMKTFKKAYRSSLDALQLAAEKADAIVHEANIAFLMNILIFEERDVAAGHLQKIRTLDELSELVETHKSPLEFQKAYTSATSAGGQCPFIPGPAGRRAPGEKSFHRDEGGVCPWPFVWLHDPKSALVVHPKKNLAGLGLIGVMARVTWKYPVQAFVGFLVTAVALKRLKPKKKSDSDP